ncbi:hypothetical protein M422DRAFT_246255 [Sphaerobolus stellatus SS14]|nr:hypothetical protein M422DRAFT_246255 [Sphaerobolus stellatus SS14]
MFLCSTSFWDLLQRGTTVLPSLERISMWNAVWSLADLTMYLTLRRTALQAASTSEIPIVVSTYGRQKSHLGIIMWLEEDDPDVDDDYHNEFDEDEAEMREMLFAQGSAEDRRYRAEAEAMGIRFTDHDISTGVV